MEPAEIEQLKAEIQKYRKAIEEHRAQKADDRCVFDDDKLYEVLGDGIKCDRRVGSKEEMFKNCQRFIENRCLEGGWRTYAELEKENEDLKKENEDLKKACRLLRYGYYYSETNPYYACECVEFGERLSGLSGEKLNDI